jgi:hypothetical protein
MLSTVKHALPVGKIKTDLRVDITFNTYVVATTTTATLSKCNIENPRIHYVELQMPYDLSGGMERLELDFE